MKIRIFDKTMVITSKITEEVAKRALTLNPDGLTLQKYEEGSLEDVFAISFNNKGTGSLQNFGISFNGVTKQGFLCLTMQIEDAAKVAEKYLVAFNNLQTLEDMVIENNVEVLKTIEEVNAAIEIVELDVIEPAVEVATEVEGN